MYDRVLSTLDFQPNITYTKSMKKVQSNSMFNSDLTPMFDGCVMMNEASMKDKAVMAALQALYEDDFKFRSTNFDHVTFDQFIGK